MTSTRLRALAALLAAALACHNGPERAILQGPACQLPAPQPSALPTLPAVAQAGQSQAIHFPATATGQTVSFTVPAGIESVTIVEQAASPAVPLTVSAGTVTVENTPVPLTITVAGNPTPIYSDVPMPPPAAFRQVGGITVLDPASDSGLAVYFLSSGAWIGALTMPNTSVPIPGTGAGVPAGDWTVTVGDWAHECRTVPSLGCTAPTVVPSLYDVTVILKPAAAPSSALAVVFHLVTTSGLTSASLDLQRVGWAVGYFLNQAGITASISYADVPPAVSAQYATGVDAASSGVCGGLGQLVQLAGPGNQLHVFLVDFIKDTGGPAGFTTIGLDPIVPGPASFGGTPASGVLVSLANLGRIRSGSTGCTSSGTGTPILSLDNCGDDRVGFVVAHEAGHFLGLYHTTEMIGTIVDPIADTPTCLCPVCKPTSQTQQCQGLGTSDPRVTSPYQMLVSDCTAPTALPGCGGGDNLMFWLLGPGQQGILSPGQAAVMRASPLVE